ncbi:MAG TPA: hypothetical protein VNZ64_20645 [Candidatus Acidoferrum sp.]|nr:hypothetical protein [Candidatus Acidoferrum sp.]
MAHLVVDPRAVLARKQTGTGVTEAYRSDSVQHVRKTPSSL